MPEVPVGVISADALEQVAVYPPQDFGFETYETEELAPSRKRERVRLPLATAAGPSESVRFCLTAGTLLLVDTFVISSCLIVTAYVLNLTIGLDIYSSMFAHLGATLVCYVVIGSRMKLFPATAMSPVLELRQLVHSCLIAVGLVLLLNKLFVTLSYSEIVIGSLGGFAAAVALPFARTGARHVFAKWSWWGERAIIIGAGPQGVAIYNFYRRAPQRGLRPVGLVDLPQTATDSTPNLGTHEIPFLGKAERIARLTRRYKLRWGIVAPAGCDAMSMNEVMKVSEKLKNLIVLPSQYLLPSLWSSSHECAGVLGVHISDHLRSPLARTIKKTIDLLVATAALIVLSPVILAIAMMVKWKSPGPAFFGHERIGRNGRRFKAWKLRTMVSNASEVLEEHLEKDPEMRMQWMEDQKLKDDPRIIPGIGHFLRKTSLDELPQLMNILKGEMSIVGPRPIVTSEIERYGEMYSMYLRVVPGITGLWQVSGRNDTSYEQRVRLDYYYVCNWSVWLDAYILVRTVRTLVLREGAY